MAIGVGFGFIILVLLTLGVEFFFYLHLGEWESFRVYHLMVLFGLNLPAFDGMKALGAKKIILWVLDLRLWGLFVWGGLLSFLAVEMAEKD